jgi:uncharacterized protein YjdB
MVTVTPSSAALAVDETQQLTATTLSGRGAVLTGRAVTWASSDPSTVTVTGTGQITGVAAGTAVVSATSEGKSGSAAITVTFVPVLTSLSLTPAAPTVYVGLTTQITATAQDQKGGNLTGATFTYRSSDQTIASVSNTGLVTGVAAGMSRITVTGTIGAVTQSASVLVTVTVTPAPVFTSMSITPATPSVVAGLTTQLTASAQDQNGAPMAGATFTYRSADLTIATVSSTGLVTGAAVGTIHIYVTGTFGAVTQSASVLVTVVAANVTVLATTGNVFTPQTVSIPRGGKVMWAFEALHNVTFALSGGSTRIPPPPPPDIPNTSSGSATRTFPAPGRYVYRCTIHPSMSGIVYVRGIP